MINYDGMNKIVYLDHLLPRDVSIWNFQKLSKLFLDKLVVIIL